jgi:hypothetical protein
VVEAESSTDFMLPVVNSRIVPNQAPVYDAADHEPLEGGSRFDEFQRPSIYDNRLFVLYRIVHFPFFANNFD